MIWEGAEATGKRKLRVRGRIVLAQALDLILGPGHGDEMWSRQFVLPPCDKAEGNAFLSLAEKGKENGKVEGRSGPSSGLTVDSQPVGLMQRAIYGSGFWPGLGASWNESWHLAGPTGVLLVGHTASGGPTPHL